MLTVPAVLGGCATGADEAAGGSAAGVSAAPSPQDLAPIGELPAEPAAPQVIACLGDSITFGWGVLSTRDRDAWPAVLQGLLGDGCEVLNLGVCDATLLDGGDVAYLGTGNVEVALAARPSTILLMLGTNDTRDYVWDAHRYELGLRSLVERLSEGDWGHRVVPMVPPKAFMGAYGGPRPGTADDALIAGQVRPTVLRVSEEYGLTCIDLYALTEGHPEWFPDGLHPNAEGNRAIAYEVYERLW